MFQKEELKFGGAFERYSRFTAFLCCTLQDVTWVSLEPFSVRGVDVADEATYRVIVKIRRKQDQFNAKVLEPLARPTKVIFKTGLKIVENVAEGVEQAGEKIGEAIDSPPKPPSPPSKYDYRKHYGVGHHHGH